MKRAGEAIEETVDNVVQGLKQRLASTSGAVQEQYQRARASVHDMSVQARVYSRLHWDKALGDSKVELEVKDGVATLRGTVKTPLAKAKAVDLARDTIGIPTVSDRGPSWPIESRRAPVTRAALWPVS